ncbi:MAG: DUF2958 domain-containing protein [Deferribacteres bacterium]|nr:DUF2958 domain-containing protein [candidate division KSB1 bacterium]MCB9503071.1 DUF2958 domain-containing protein [Deferribacteres bacterium]
MWNIPTQEELVLIPRLYETEHIPVEEKIIHLHFFIGQCDWYIAEFDGGDLFFGYANLGDDEMAEWGYISFQELKDICIRGIEVDRDLYWKPKKFSFAQRY